MKSFFMALSTLTCLPFPSGKGTSGQMKNSVIFYPLAGGLIGALLALVWKSPLPNNLQALLTLILWVLLTLAFHLDGLGDCLDGWFGGKDPKERRRIMKGSTLGVYGAVGIVLVLISKYVLLEHLFTKTDGWKWLIAIPAGARFATAVSCFISKPPKGDHGLGSLVLGLSFPGFLLSLLFLSALIPWFRWYFLWLLGIALAVSMVISSVSKNRIGGLTGDGLGATIELTEVALLFLACLSFV
jgi:adenosylcobinamide-GDP ribazoletransferase